MSNSVSIKSPSGLLQGSPVLPASKSESNRALMINHYSGGSVSIENLSNARDTRTLSRLLNQNESLYDAQDAGTTFRFLTSMLACGGNGSILTGSERMQQRPIRILVDALRKIGCSIEYLEKEGFPPLSFKSFVWNGNSEIEIDATISSQYISSLMMAAPTLPNGLKILLKDSISSLPYLKMTWNLMEQCGIQGTFNDQTFTIPAQKYSKSILEVESDWSAASYWFGMGILSKRGCDVFLVGLKMDSLQGDSEIHKIAKLWGLETQFSESGARIQRPQSGLKPEFLELNFQAFPDLAQTIIVICALSGTEAKFTGLQSLAIKETNRLLALKIELAKISIHIEIDEKSGYCFVPGKQTASISEPITFQTYDDHRMAMALSLVSMVLDENIQISEPIVVQKSYPLFWDALKSCNFIVA